MRVGKVGFTFSTTFSHLRRNSVEFRNLIRINEYRTESFWKFHASHPKLRFQFHSDFELQEFSDVKFFDFEIRYNHVERLLIAAKTDQNDLAKVHMGWGTDKVFAITTPKVYPGYLILNLETTKELNDYKFEVGLSREDDSPWEVYGFHIQQKQLGHGRDLHISGEAGEAQFSIDGTITLYPFYNNDLYIKERFVLELNHRKIGCLTHFQTNSGFFENTYTGDLQIILPDQTVHWGTDATSSNKKFNFLSKFRWNEDNSKEQPIIFTVDIDDTSDADHEKTLKAVFSHPQIEDLTLQGHIKYQSKDSPMFAHAEFIDQNTPDQNIYFNMQLKPISENGEYIIQSNITQPSSNFEIHFDSVIVESVFNTASYKLKYWNHLEQKWKAMDMTTSIDSVDQGWHFTADINKSDSNWGYNYNGSLLYQGNSVTFDIIGVSRHFMDYWRFETSVNKYLPELEMQLQVGQSRQDPHETGRVRVGLHNPLEMGVIVDHERFGVWRQDARAGLRLKSQDILQFILEFDPSFDFTDQSVIYRMTSPANKIARAWLRDLSYTASAFYQWALTDALEVLNVLLNNETGNEILSYAVQHLESFIQNVISHFSSLYEDLSDTWTQNVEPFFFSSYNSAENVYRAMESYFRNTFYIMLDWNQIVEFVNIQSVRFHDQMIEDFDRFSIWWTKTNQEMALFFNNMMYKMVRGMNTFSEAMKEVLLLLQEIVGPTFESYQMAFDRYGLELEAIFGGQCWPKIQQQVLHLADSLRVMKYMGERFFQPSLYSQQLQIFKDWLVNLYNNNKEAFRDGFSQLQEAVIKSALFEELINEYNIVEYFVSEVIRDGFYGTVSHRFSQMVPQIMATGEQVVYDMQKYYNEFQQYARGNIIFDYFDAVTANAVNRILLTWQQWREREQELVQTFQRLLLSFNEFLRNLVIQEADSFIDGSIFFEPNVRGKIIYNQYLPVPWNSFLEGPQWFRFTNIFFMETPLEESKRKLAEGFDRVYGVMEALTVARSYTPPFSATATVYGQQITTFDLLHYHFLGSCSYLMTKDFVGGDFEVIGDYSRSEDGEISLKSMIIRAQGTDVIFRMDGTHDVNINMGAAEVNVDENYLTFKQGELFVTCNKISRGCSVTVGRKYFGRLAGLFGNYNYEPSDDFKGPDGSYAKNSGNLANKWAVSTNTCYQANQVRIVEHISQVNDFNVCHKLYLRDNSPFSRCFILVDPRPYFWHCIRDQKRPDFGHKFHNSPCDSTDAYRTQCASRGIHMHPLEQCPRGKYLRMEKDTGKPKSAEPEYVEPEVVAPVYGEPELAPAQPITGNCEVFGETVPTGWSETYEGATQGSADVAFVIEAANCNKDRNLQLLLRLVKVQLKRAGIQDVRYALVTTQGSTMHLRASLVSEEELVTELANLVVEGPKADNGGADAVIETARHLTWRPGVARNIIQLPCRACDDGSAVTEALLENDVTYHIITKFKIVVNGPNAQKSKAMATKVWGYDTQQVYTPKDAKKFAGNVNLRKLLQDPEGSSCMEASQASGGSIFNINKWTSKSVANEKKYLGVIGQRVVKSSSAPECQECRCLGGGDTAEVSCRKCGAEWPPVEEVQQVQEVQQISQEGAVQEGGEEEEEEEVEETEVHREQKTMDETEDVFQDIKKNFKDQFINQNAAFAHLHKDLQKEHQEGGGEEEGHEGGGDDHEGGGDDDEDDEDSSEEIEEVAKYEANYNYSSEEIEEDANYEAKYNYRDYEYPYYSK